MGAGHRKLSVPGEEEFAGMGVSYCATCDGAFFKDKVTAVVGGGDVAAEDAVFLARGCRKVYLIHRREELRAAKILQETVLGLENVEPVWNSVVTENSGRGPGKKPEDSECPHGRGRRSAGRRLFYRCGNQAQQRTGCRKT